MKRILKNGLFYTADTNMPWADTVVIADDTIDYVGTYDKSILENYILQGASEHDLKGRMAIPGIVDSHTHPGMISQSSWHIDMPWTEDPQVVLAFIREYAEKHPKEEVPFLYFQYYPTSMFDTKGPSKKLLDQVVSDRPCYCQDFGGHLHWMNSKMLEMMEITKDTPDPTPGLEVFVRDENGEPTGWVKEHAWRHFQDKLWDNIGWKPPEEITPELIKPFFDYNTEHGITAIAEGTLEGEAQIKSMFELDRQGLMNFYYDGAIRFWSLGDLAEKIAISKEYDKRYGGKHIKFNTMKLFLDGTNESGNSAVLRPHLNDPTGQNYGEIKMHTDELTDCLLLCNEDGQDIEIHIVGDRAFKVACDAVEKAKEKTLREGKEWVTQVIFLHCELIDPDDMLRPTKLGVTVNWSPHWSGGYFGEEAINYIGKEIWEEMYQFNPIIESGALVTFSSDVVSLYELRHRAHPFLGMQIAHTRIDSEITLPLSKYPNGMRPKENAKLSRECLLKGYTISGARQLRWEDKMGSLEKGKLANLSILSDNYFEVPEDKMKNIQFEVVMFEGKVIKGML